MQLRILRRSSIPNSVPEDGTCCDSDGGICGCIHHISAIEALEIFFLFLFLFFFFFFQFLECNWTYSLHHCAVRANYWSFCIVEWHSLLTGLSVCGNHLCDFQCDCNVCSRCCHCTELAFKSLWYACNNHLFTWSTHSSAICGLATNINIRDSLFFGLYLDLTFAVWWCGGGWWVKTLNP